MNIKFERASCAHVAGTPYSFREAIRNASEFGNNDVDVDMGECLF